MITRVVIPQLFENMEEATIGAWLVGAGAAIERGDALCDLITEKTTVQLEAEGEGTLKLVVVAEKSVVPVGTIIAVIAGDDDDTIGVGESVAAENQAIRARAAATHKTEAVAPPAKSPAPGGAPATATVAAGGSRLRATPAARRAARELGYDLEAVAAKNPGKVLSEDDVRDFGA